MTQEYKDGVQYLKQHEYESALACFLQVIQNDPHHYSAELNAGVALAGRNRYAEALPYLESSARKHQSRLVNSNLGICFNRLNRYDDAEDAFRKALALEPDHALTNYYFSDVLLAQGRYAEGWKQISWRKKTALWDDVEPYPGIPTWHGETLDDDHVLAIFHEQGLGDSLMLARYIPLVCQKVKNVNLICPTALHALFATSFNIINLPSFVSADRRSGVDVQCSLYDLPALFGISLDEHIPRPPYLHADPRLIATWREVIKTLPDQPNVGLVWAGAPRRHSSIEAADTRRSLAFDQLAPLFQNTSINFIALQKGEAIWQARCSETPPYDWTDQLATFADTAALIANLDLVIAVDTAVVHLAAGMGKPVWLLNRFDSCWRWQPEGHNPWYANVRDFRQPSSGDWDSVVQHVCAALQSSIN